MKNATKIFLLIAILFCFTTTCFAGFQPDAKRWIWITSDSERTLWYDKYTVQPKKINGKNTVDLWILCYRNNPEETIMKTNWTIDITNRKILVNNGYVYDMNKNLIAETDDEDQNQTWHPIVPETASEKIYIIANRYFRNKYRK